MTPDGELLRRYAELHSEEAFAELVRRHLDLVYSAALRQVNGDSHLAQDVAQAVFTDLSRKAAALARRPVLTGWLYTSTHFAAAKAVRTERRRYTHEQEAQAMQELLHSHPPDFDWEKLRPVLDQVMHELKSADRDVILMRYFENRQLADIGEKFGLSEDAARKRVDRALEKLRTFLTRRGIAATSALATALSANAVQAAPAGLAATLTSASVAATVAATGSTLTIIKLMTLTKLQVGIIGAVVVVGVATPFVMQQQSKWHEENQSLRQQLDQMVGLQTENERLSNLLARTETPPGANGQLSELLRLRNEVGYLRGQTNQIGKLQAESQQLQAALASASSRRMSVATPSALARLPKESWGYAGYADPESAFQTTIWAMSQGDAKTYLVGLVPDGKEAKGQQGKTEAEVAERSKKEVARVTGFTIVDKENVSDDEVVLTVFAHGVNDVARFRTQRVGNEWKLDGPVKDGDRGENGTR